MLVGLVGKPSSGKTTLFNALTLQDAATAPYPFTTLKPNRGVAYARVACVDQELGVACQPRHGWCEQGTRFVPVEVLDVAGLVPGASQGRGKGNAFLADLATANVLVHVVDAAGATTEEGEPCQPGARDPVEDVRFLEREIGLWFAQVVERNWARLAKKPLKDRGARAAALAQALAGVGATRAHTLQALQRAGLEDTPLGAWNREAREAFAFRLREASKPVVVAANKADLAEAGKNIARLKKVFPEAKVYPCSALSELALKKAARQGAVAYAPGNASFSPKKALSPEQEKGLAFIRKHVLEQWGGTGVQALLDGVVFGVLGCIAVFPVATARYTDTEGRVLPDCLLLPAGATVLDLAYRLHTDIGKHFVRATNLKKGRPVARNARLRHREVIHIAHAAR